MSTPAGWRPDAEVPATQRYWDGSTWTDHVAPVAPPRAPEKEKVQIGGLLIAVIPIIGVVVGLIMLAQHKPRTGTAMILIGITSFGLIRMLA